MVEGKVDSDHEKSPESSPQDKSSLMEVEINMPDGEMDSEHEESLNHPLQQTRLIRHRLRWMDP